MPPLNAHPLMIDLSSPPILVERIFPAATREFYRMEWGEKRLAAWMSG